MNYMVPIFKKLAELKKKEMDLIDEMEEEFRKLMPEDYVKTMTLEDMDNFEKMLEKGVRREFYDLHKEPYIHASYVSLGLHLMRFSIKERIKKE